MPSTGSAVMLTIGAAFAGGWLSTLGQAKNDVGILGRALEETTQKQNDLGLSGLDAHRKKEAALSSANKALDDYKKSIEGINDLSEDQADILEHLTKRQQIAENAYKNSEKAVKRQSIALKAEGKDVNTVTREYDRLGAQRKKIEDLGNAWAGAKTHLASFGKVVAAYTGIFTAGTAAAYKFVNSTAAEGDAIERTSKRLGMGVAAFQEYRFAAQQSGMSISSFENGMDKFARGLDNAIVKKSGPAHDALKRLGLDAQALITLPMEERMKVVADAIAKVGDESARASITGGLFGENDGRAFRDFFADGSAGLEKGRQNARDSGAVWDTSGSAEYQKSLQGMKESLASLGRVVGSTLMPAFTKLNNAIKNAIMGNGGQAGKVVSALLGVVKGLASVLIGVVKVFGGLIYVLSKIPGLITVLTWGFVALAAAIALNKFGMAAKGAWALLTPLKAMGTGGLLTTITGKFGGMFTGLKFLGTASLAAGKAILFGVVPALWSFTVALLANPITWVVLAIVGLIVAIVALWKNWDAVTGWIANVWNTVWDGIVGYFKWSWENLKKVFSLIKDALFEIFSWSPLGLIMRGFGAAFNWLEEKFGIFSKIGSAIKSVASFFGFGGGDESPSGETESTASIDTSLPVAKSGGNSITNTNTISITQLPGEDAEALARRTAELIAQKEESMFAESLAATA